MVKISIELISRGEETVKEVLKSIDEQSFGNIEIIVVNASSSRESDSILKHFGANVVNVSPATGHLEARYIANEYASGEYRVLLDSTRPLEPNALELLINKYQSYSAVCLREGSIGTGFWVRQAQLLKYLSDNSFFQTRGIDIAYILPRFYKAKLLDSAFELLRRKMNDSLFKSISYGEHHLIYEACNLKSTEVTLTDETLIRHYEDEKVSSIVRKYKRYGEAQKFLNNIKFKSQSKSLFSHKRPFLKENLKYELETVPIRFVRISSFIIGFLS